MENEMTGHLACMRHTRKGKRLLGSPGNIWAHHIAIGLK
jgi:hypothetical protein